MRLDGKVTIITGGGSGMGRTASELFAREGARVVVADFSEAAGEETVALVRAGGGEASYVKADVSEEQDARGMVQFAISRYGSIQVRCGQSMSAGSLSSRSISPSSSSAYSASGNSCPSERRRYSMTAGEWDRR